MNDQELSIDQLSAVIGGASNTGSSMSHPKPPPNFLQWILSLFK
jgi:bacteriocin-like protein